MSNYNVLAGMDGVCYCYPLPVSVIKGYLLRSQEVYYLRYNVRYGSLSWRVIYARLQDMARYGQLRNLAFIHLQNDGSIVFFWRAEGWDSVMEQLRFWANYDTSSGLPPLADFEFVHPFSATIICSMGVYSSEKFVDNFRHAMGRCVIDLKQSLWRKNG